MKVGDLVRFNEVMAPWFRKRSVRLEGTTTPTAIVLSTWTDVQPGINIEEQWCEVMWPSGRLAEHRTVLFEVINESR